MSQASLFDGYEDSAKNGAATRPGRLPVRVIRSPRRRRTVHAQLVNGEILVRVPARMSKREEARYVRELVERIEKREQRSALDLDSRARELARRYGLPAPASVRFVDNQRSRWGSCTIDTREIRLSSRLASFPTWVLDYVIVHELAHLVVADHSPKFHALVDRYPKAERARGYLIAKADGL
ncbi:MAG TPA: M48 family metallopeptidase [Acidimicrobiales bacterium]